MHLYTHIVLAQAAALARHIDVRLNHVAHRLSTIGMSSMHQPIHRAVVSGASFLDAIYASSSQRQHMANAHVKHITRLISECAPDHEDARFALTVLGDIACFTPTQRQTIVDAIAAVMRPMPMSVRGSPAMLGWTQQHEQFQGCKALAKYITLKRWSLIMDPNVPIQRVYQIFATQAFEIGLRTPLNTTIARMLAIASISGRAITRDTFWDQMRDLKAVFCKSRLSLSRTPCGT